MNEGQNINEAQSADVDPWRMAYAAILEIGMARGLRVSTSWLWSAMGLSQVPTRKPGESDAAFARRAQSWNLRVFKPQTDQLVEHILDVHGLYLRSVGAGPNRPGEWELLDGSAAPEIAKRAIRDIKKTIGQTRVTIASLSVDGLTAQQVSARDDSVAKLAALDTLMRRGRPG